MKLLEQSTMGENLTQHTECKNRTKSKGEFAVSLENI